VEALITFGNTLYDILSNFIVGNISGIAHDGMYVYGFDKLFGISFDTFCFTVTFGGTSLMGGPVRRRTRT